MLGFPLAKKHVDEHVEEHVSLAFGTRVRASHGTHFRSLVLTPNLSKRFFIEKFHYLKYSGVQID